MSTALMLHPMVPREWWEEEKRVQWSRFIERQDAYSGGRDDALRSSWHAFLAMIDGVPPEILRKMVHAQLAMCVGDVAAKRLSDALAPGGLPSVLLSIFKNRIEETL